MVAEARLDLGRHVARYAMNGIADDAAFVLVRSFGRYTTNLPLEGSWTGRRGSRSTSTAKTWRHNAAVLPACSFRTRISGRVPSGCAASRCGSATNLDSGRAMVTTSAEIHGRNSGTRAAELEGLHGRQAARRDRDRTDDHTGVARVARRCPRPLPRPARGAAALTVRLGHRDCGAANGLGPRRQTGLPFVRPHAGKGPGRSGLTAAARRLP
jgi:hypothetical protein